MDFIFIDHDLVILNKPAGLSVLPEGWSKDQPYLLHLVEGELGRVWVVHRLDKLTSGVMVLARTAEAHRSLSMQFEGHRVEKCYRAICIGVPEWEEKTVRQPLRADVGHKHRTVVDGQKGKPAATLFKVLERFQAHSLLEAKPLTGRTHQVRVHAYAMGYPLLGDPLYGSSGAELIARPALHAFSLKILQPVSKDWTTRLENIPDWSQIEFEAPYPDDILSALTSLYGTPSRV